MGELASKLGRLAVTGNLAILLLSQTSVRVRSDSGALLHPAISGAAWDAGINNRIVFFRDWLFKSLDVSSQDELQPGVRFAGVMKAKGMAYDGVGRVVAFTIQKVMNLHPGGIPILKSTERLARGQG